MEIAVLFSLMLWAHLGTFHFLRLKEAQNCIFIVRAYFFLRVSDSSKAHLNAAPQTVFSPPSGIFMNPKLNAVCLQPISHTPSEAAG